jgi:hypothetical protein
VDVNKEGAAGDDVGCPFTAHEATRGPFTTSDRGDRSYRRHGRGASEHAACCSHHSGPSLATHSKRGRTLMGKDANRNRL